MNTLLKYPRYRGNDKPLSGENNPKVVNLINPPKINNAHCYDWPSTGDSIVAGIGFNNVASVDYSHDIINFTSAADNANINNVADLNINSDVNSVNGGFGNSVAWNAFVDNIVVIGDNSNNNDINISPTCYKNPVVHPGHSLAGHSLAGHSLAGHSLAGHSLAWHSPEWYSPEWHSPAERITTNQPEITGHDVNLSVVDVLPSRTDICNLNCMCKCEGPRIRRTIPRCVTPCPCKLKTKCKYSCRCESFCTCKSIYSVAITCECAVVCVCGLQKGEEDAILDRYREENKTIILRKTLARTKFNESYFDSYKRYFKWCSYYGVGVTALPMLLYPTL